MNPFLSTITLSLIVTAHCLAAGPRDLKDLKYMDLYGDDKAAKVFFYKKEPGSVGATFNILRVNPEVQAAGGSVAILEEIRSLRALANQDVYVGRGPDRMGHTIYGTVEPVPGSGFPQYEKRGLRSGDLARLQSLLESIPAEQQKNPTIRAIFEQFRSAKAKSELDPVFQHPAFRPQKAAAAISLLDALAGLVGETNLGTLNESLTFGGSKEKLTIRYTEGKPYIVDRAGVSISNVSLDALKAKLLNIKFTNIDVSGVMGKLKKGGGTLGTVAVGALVPILLSHAMVGDANAAQDNKEPASTVRSTQPYIQSAPVVGAK